MPGLDHVQGFAFELTSDMIVGFVDGLKKQGAELPSVAREQSIEQASVAQAHLVRTVDADIKRAERPQKRKIGAQLCRLSAGWTEVGFTEGITDNKIQIRIVERVMGSATDGRFRETIIWADPDNWSLCP